MIARPLLDASTPWVDVVISVGTAGGIIGGAAIFWLSLLDQRKSQAKLISAWIWSRRENMGRSRVVRQQVTELFIRNGSDQPIHEARVWSLRHVGEAAGTAYLPAGEVHQEAALEEMTDPLSERTDQDLILRFTDASGLGWQRLNGKLTRARWWNTKHGSPRAWVRFSARQDQP